MPKVIGYDPVDLGYGGMINYSGADNNKVLDDVKDGNYPAISTDPNYGNVISLMKFEDNYTDDKGLLTWTGTGTSFNASGKFGKAVEFNSTSHGLGELTIILLKCGFIGILLMLVHIVTCFSPKLAELSTYNII